jgi:hypothetical protein
LPVITDMCTDSPIELIASTWLVAACVAALECLDRTGHVADLDLLEIGACCTEQRKL